MKKQASIAVTSGLIAICLGGCQIPPISDSADSMGQSNPSRSTDPQPGPSLTRSQKPEKKISDLDYQPERSGEAANTQKVASIRAMVNTRPIFDEELRQACAP